MASDYTSGEHDMHNKALIRNVAMIASSKVTSRGNIRQ